MDAEGIERGRDGHSVGQEEEEAVGWLRWTRGSKAPPFARKPEVVRFLVALLNGKEPAFEPIELTLAVVVQLHELVFHAQRRAAELAGVGY